MTNKTVLTARENETLALTWQCFMTEPKYTPGSARFAFRAIRNKLKAIAEEASVPSANKNTTTAAAAKAAPAAAAAPKRKRAAKKKADFMDDSDDDKPKKKARKNSGVKKGEADGEGEASDATMGSDGGEAKMKIKKEMVEMDIGEGGDGEEEV